MKNYNKETLLLLINILMLSIGITKSSGQQVPDTAWVFSNKTQRLKLDGFCQGSLLNHGKGKVAVFGEAAMFTAQIVNGNMKVGFNSEDAPQNAQFILNLIHWMDGQDNQ